MVRENLTLMKIIEKVDWNLIATIESRLGTILSEFQTTVDALLAAIEVDMKRWKRQNADLQ